MQDRVLNESGVMYIRAKRATQADRSRSLERALASDRADGRSEPSMVIEQKRSESVRVEHCKWSDPGHDRAEVMIDLMPFDRSSRLSEPDDGIEHRCQSEPDGEIEPRRRAPQDTIANHS